jgi:hypothetical protein
MLLLLTGDLFGQRAPAIEVSVLAGVPLDVVQSNICCSTASFVHQEVSSNYVAGASFGVLLTEKWRVEFGASYMPFSYRTTGTTCCPISHPVNTTHGTAWELPALVTYRWSNSGLRPFSGGGFVVHDATSGSPSQAPAPVIRGGVELGKERWAVRPEFRYVFYSQRADSTDQRIGRASAPQFLVGFSVRVW